MKEHASPGAPARHPPTGRGWLGPLAVAVIASASAWLSACGGGTSSNAPTERSAALVPARAGEIVAYMQQRLRRQTPAPSGALQVGGLEAAPSSDLAAAPRSSTVLLEAGVDEDDLIKADDEHVYTLHDGHWRSDRLLAGGQLQRVQSIALPMPADGILAHYHGMYGDEAGARMLVLGARWEFGVWQGGCEAIGCEVLAMIAPLPTVQRVLLQAVELGAPAGLGTQLEIDGELLGSRRIGSALVLVTQHRPPLAAGALAPQADASAREDRIASLAAEDVLPRLRVNGNDAGALFDETDCYLQPANASDDIVLTAITVVDLADPALPVRSRCFAGGTEALAMTPEALVLATTRWNVITGTDGTVYPDTMQTDLHRFAFDGRALQYRASGSVEGHLGWDAERKSTRLSVQGDLLRVLTYTGQTGWVVPVDGDGTVSVEPVGSPSPARLTILRTDGNQLAEVARLPNAQRPQAIGKPDEQVYAVRFVGDRAYVVTFLRIDPLVVIDLANPADPFIAGELEAPGFSDDLYALADGWLLGVGRDADAEGRVLGVKVALIDVRDAAHPQIVSSQTYGEAGAMTALDTSRHGIDLRIDGTQARVALPMVLWSAEGSWQHGLQRIDVDTAAGTLASKPLIDAPSADWPDLWQDRSLQIGERVIYLSQGQLGAYDW